jgi:hypothetical protein
MGVPAQNLVTSSVMSIPASISISKMRFPEKDEPITRGRVVVDRGEEEKNRPVCIIVAMKVLLGSFQVGKCSSCIQQRSCLRSYCCGSNPVRAIFLWGITAHRFQDESFNYPVPGCNVRNFCMVIYH